ncbi:hypothetical protein C1S70_26180 (plasmid) [Azospirillum argentinense]|uniref:Pentapeptide repeat-containing protein n=1 Tax=Azospirillum argentinense TaxID=2970906 RepID=A0A2K1FTY4_9PROT|nr:hypothetical protein C1S70_26180 [Azospirillum argentinense]
MSERFRISARHESTPAERVRPSAEALDAVLAAHRLWLESVGQEGRQADLRHADLSGRSLWRADLRRARLDGCDLRGADLDHADASGANFDGACLERASLWNARLGAARLCQADLRNANLDHADLSGADLSDADCTETICGERGCTVPTCGPQPALWAISSPTPWVIRTHACRTGGRSEAWRVRTISSRNVEPVGSFFWRRTGTVPSRADGTAL